MKETQQEVRAKAPPLGALPASEQIGVPALTLDIGKFSKFLAEGRFTEAQERRALEALWEVMVAVASMGFNIHPVQQAIAEESTLVSDSPSMVGFENNSKINEEKDAGRGDARAAQRSDS